MQLTNPTPLLALLTFLATAKAVEVCSGFNSGTGGCVPGTCTNFDIAENEIIETPGTNCIFNSNTDTDFNLMICGGPNLSGGCTQLSNQPRVTITGDFNWDTPNTGSIQRNGN